MVAGLCNGRVAVWEYIDGKWNGEKAAALYKGVIKKALKKNYPRAKVFKVLEDNDPVGYKSSKGKRAKKEAGIQTVDLPKYSPDLNPLDYWLWKDIDTRAAKSGPSGKETIKAYKKRIRLIALKTKREDILKAIGGMKGRIKAIEKANGGNIKCD